MENKFLYAKSNFKKDKFDYFVIVGSIGAHHSDFAVFGVAGKKEFVTLIRASEDTSNIKKVSSVLNEVLSFAHKEYNIEINRCCIAASGPVSRRRGYIKLTNYDFEVNTKDIMDNTMLNKVILVNDFEAMGYGLDFVDLKKDVDSIEHVGEDLTGSWTRENVYSMMGASTGLGMTVTYYNLKDHLHVPLPSEGGHTDFISHDAFDCEFVEYLKNNVLEKKESHPDFERALSGEGMINLYNFIKSKKTFPESKITKEIDSADEGKKLEIIESNYSKDKTCKEVLDKTVSYFARLARSLALTSESYSGLFLTGKIIDNNLELFKSGDFMTEFEKHDKRSDILRKVPIYVIKKDDIGLIGCCNVASNFYNLV